MFVIEIQLHQEGGNSVFKDYYTVRCNVLQYIYALMCGNLIVNI